MDIKSELDRLRHERHLYRSLLDLGDQTDPASFLREALGLVVELTAASNGYIELNDPRKLVAAGGWSIAHGFSASEVDDVRSRVSKGIIAGALATGQLIGTSSALLDARFSERGSVRALKIEAVLGIPISSDPPLGVLYLQGHAGGGLFAPKPARVPRSSRINWDGLLIVCSSDCNVSSAPIPMHHFKRPWISMTS